jgi:anti-anti-sigma factor
MDLVRRTAIIGDLPAIQLSGDVDLSTVPVLHDALRRFVDEHRGRTVAVDLDGVDVLDDAGLGVVLGAAGRAREHGGDLVVVCTAPRLTERLQLTGVARAVEVRDRLAR